MPRTAPTVDGTPNVGRLTLRVIDASGDKRAESIEISPTAADGDIEAIVVAYALRSHVNVYSVERHAVYAAPATAGDATTGEKSDSVADGINYLFVSNTMESEGFRLMAPVASQMIGDSDAVEPVAGAAFGALVEAVLTGTKVLVSAQYTERKEKQNNPKTSF